jgi:RNA polymerase sigma-70 factor (ECF subfamily)
MAFLVMLERLAPEERAALLLRDVFDADYGEIARVLEKNEAAARQMVHRARTRVRSDRARFTVPPETKEHLAERFISAIQADDQDALLALVSHDATFTSDGGGRVPAIRNILHGADRIVRFLFGIERKYGSRLRHEIAWINGEPAVATYTSDGLFCTTSFETDGEHIVGFYRVLNPDKLRNAVQ